MPPIWKSIVVSLIIFVAILTACFLKTVAYLQAKVFNEGAIVGSEVTWFLGGAAVILFVINVAVAKMLSPKDGPKST